MSAYNVFMMEYINFIFVVLIIDFILCCSLKKLFKLNVTWKYLLFVQIPNICVSIIFCFCELSFCYFLMLKIASMFVVCLLITNSYSAKELFLIWSVYGMLFFSGYGFYQFMTLFFKCVIFEIFEIKIAKQFDFIIFFAIILYILLNYCVLSKMIKQAKIKNLIHKVSFFIFGKHIEIVGLCDTGNSLVDEKTKVPVIVVSFDSLQKHFVNMHFCDLEKVSTRNVKCVTAGENLIEIPVVDVGFIEIENGIQKDRFRAVVAVTKQKFFDTRKYDCLLHRDFA